MKIDKYDDIPLTRYSGHFKMSYNPLSLLIKEITDKKKKNDSAELTKWKNLLSSYNFSKKRWYLYLTLLWEKNQNFFGKTFDRLKTLF